MRLETPAYHEKNSEREVFVHVGAVFLSAQYARGARLHFFSHAVRDESVSDEQLAEGSSQVYNALIHVGLLQHDDKIVVFNWFSSERAHQIVHINHVTFTRTLDITSASLVSIYGRMLTGTVRGRVEGNQRREVFFANVVNGAYTAFDYAILSPAEIATRLKPVETYIVSGHALQMVDSLSAKPLV